MSELTGVNATTIEITVLAEVASLGGLVPENKLRRRMTELYGRPCDASILELTRPRVGRDALLDLTHGAGLANGLHFRLTRHGERMLAEYERKQSPGRASGLRELFR